MLHQYFLKLNVLGFLLISAYVFGQNQAPVISNINASVDWSQQLININYDVSDAEGDMLEITLKVSSDSGKSFLYSSANVSGDIGFPVSSGNGKSLSWDYNDSIQSFSKFVFALEVSDRQPVNIQDIVDQIDSASLYNNVSFLEGVRHRNTGLAHLENTRDTLLQRFHNYGIWPWIQSFYYNQDVGQNIIGHLPGMKNPDTVYIIDAHYDGVSNGPAADDNASGTAGVMEAARILSEYTFDKSIRFIGFDMEEDGLRGSKAYVNTGIRPGESIAGVLNFEMIGYYSEKNNSQTVPSGFSTLFPAAHAQLQADNFRGNFIATVANTSSDPLNAHLKSSAQLYVPQLKVIELSVPGNGAIAPDFRRSDHAPFWDNSLPALMITDGANFRNHNYHTAHDVKDSLDFGFMTNVVKATVAAAVSLANPRHSDMEMFQVSNPIGLGELQQDCEFSVSYSKRRNSIMLNASACPAKEGTYILYNEAGTMMKQGRLRLETGEGKIDLESAPTQGVYILQVTNSGSINEAFKVLIK